MAVLKSFPCNILIAGILLGSLYLASLAGQELVRNVPSYYPGWAELGINLLIDLTVALAIANVSLLGLVRFLEWREKLYDFRERLELAPIMALNLFAWAVFGFLVLSAYAGENKNPYYQREAELMGLNRRHLNNEAFHQANKEIMAKYSTVKRSPPMVILAMGALLPTRLIAMLVSASSRLASEVGLWFAQENLPDAATMTRTFQELIHNMPQEERARVLAGQASEAFPGRLPPRTFQALGQPLWQRRLAMEPPNDLEAGQQHPHQA